MVRLCERKVVENLIAYALKASQVLVYIHTRTRVTDQSPIRLRRHRRYLVHLVLQVYFSPEAVLLLGFTKPDGPPSLPSTGPPVKRML